MFPAATLLSDESAAEAEAIELEIDCIASEAEDCDAILSMEEVAPADDAAGVGDDMIYTNLPDEQAVNSTKITMLDSNDGKPRRVCA